MKISKDKLYHLGCGALVGLFGGFICAIIVAFTWEINDKRHGGYMDFGDMAFTILGAIPTSIFYYWFMWQCWLA